MSSDCCPTIPALLVLQASKYGGREAVASTDGASLTFAELAATIEKLQAGLVACGVSRGSRVAVVLPNGINLAIGLLAASSAGIAVPLPANAAIDEYRSWLHVGRVTHLLTSAAQAAAVRVVAEELGLSQVELRHEAGRYRIHAANAVARRAKTSVRQPTEVAVVLMTSGSTGTPKRVPLTHANLLAGAASVAGSLGLGPADRVLVMWEQYHIGGLVDLLLAPLAAGGTAVYAGSFDARRFSELLDDVQPTWFQGVPTTLRELLVHARLNDRLPVASTLRCLRSVAAPLPPDLMQELETAFGVPVIQTFGMTEAAPLITTNRLPPGMRKPGSTGTPCGCEVAVLDAAGDPLPPGSTGEVAVRGPNVFAGYEDDSETNARSFRRGWFLTGDVGRLDTDGFLFLTGRVKEMINRGGEKIAPAEVEEAAVRHPAVAQAAAFAIPHPTLGEDIGLAVVSCDTTSIDRGAMRTHLAEYLSPFKLPAVVLMLAELPRCPIGKIRRRELADLAAATMATTRLPPGSRPADDPFVAGLAALWALHLDLPAIDPDADFELLGGDSLARIRLVLAAESLCGVSVPEASAATITTVRRMAADLRRLGGHPPPCAGDTDTSPVKGTTDLWGDGDAEMLADAPPETIRQRLAASRSVNEFEALRENLLNALTRHELAALAARPFLRPPTDWAGRLAARMPRWLRGAEAGQVATALAAWRDELLTLRAQASSPTWRRERLAPTVVLYRRVDSGPGRRRLIVAFAGNHRRLMLPTHVVLDHLPPGDDLLLLVDPGRRHFATGLPGIAATLAGVCDWLAARLAAWSEADVVCFGTSAGGLAAVCAGHALGCRRAVAVAADRPADHPNLERFLRSRISASAPDRPPRVILAYDPANHRDREGGEALAALLPTSRTVELAASGGHNTLRPALASGRLAALLHNLLGSDTGSLHDDLAA